jgi:hypothetical protein
VVAAVVALVVAHAGAVLFMLTGGFLTLRWRRLRYVHVPLALAIAAIFASGSDCPVTRAELWLRARAGLPGYRDGFVGHYLVGPLGLNAHRPAVQAGLFAIAVVPNVLAYGLLLRRAVHGRVRAAGR